MTLHPSPLSVVPEGPPPTRLEMQGEKQQEPRPRMGHTTDTTHHSQLRGPSERQWWEGGNETTGTRRARDPGEPTRRVRDTIGGSLEGPPRCQLEDGQ